MLLVIPSSYVDRGFIPSFVKLVKNLGDYRNHHLLVVGDLKAEYYVKSIFNELGELFATARFHTFETDAPRGWPQGSNFYFSKTVKYLQDQDNQLPWLWCELDCTPLKSGWLDIIEKEYIEGGKPFLGNCREKMLIGVAVYPPDVSKYHKGIQELPPRVAFDQHIGFDFLNHATDTKVMQTFHHTWRYQEEEGKIVGFLKRSTLSWVEPVKFEMPEGLALSHGCKDTTLNDLTAKKIGL